MKILDSMMPTKFLNLTISYRLIRYFLVAIMATSILSCDRGGESGAPFPVNSAPVVAETGPILAARIGETPVLDGSSSYSLPSAPLDYKWSFTHKPFGSKAVLQNENSPNPTFTADTKGVYTTQLNVTANGLTSERAIQVVIATLDGEPLTGPANHIGLSSNCVNCHDGILVDPSKSPNHIGTSNMCEACHTPQGAAIIPFADHQETFGNCSECHDGIKAIGKSSTHITTSAECDNCHTTVSFLALELDGSFDHTNITGGCSGCHNGGVAIGKHDAHITTNVDCSSCHTTASFKNAFPDHTDPTIIGEGCDSCHGASNGSGGLIAKGPIAGHPIPNVDCDSCHRISTFSLGGVFNHRLLDASVQSCDSCHNSTNSINALSKESTANHPATTADCGLCHNTTSFADAIFDHSNLTATQLNDCQSCHDGTIATGIPLTTPFYEHMPTTDDCSVCHTPGTFTTGTYDHAGVINGCNSCHDNKISVGKLLNHIPTTPDTQDCADCHTVDTFVGATFDHTITDTSNCLACHGDGSNGSGSISTGKSLGHVNTADNCSTCHIINNGYTTFADTFDHAADTVANKDCASCHNTGIALPKKVNHIPSKAECSQCHIDTTIPGGFASNAFLGNVHTGIISGCEGCHINKTMLPAHPNLVKNSVHLPTAQDCDVCHTNATFTPSNFAHEGITGNCSSCHSGSFTSVGARGKTTNHPATTQDCGVCHNTANFADATFDHTGRTNNCAECHADGATGAVTKKNTGHIPTTEDCSVCHVTGTFANATFDHIGIVNNCSSCHDGAGAIATVKNNGHISTTQDCSVCHNTTAFAGAKFDHTGIIDNCASCHDGITARGKTPPPNHVPTNQDCSICHITTGFRPATFDHVGIVDNCASCHDGKFARGKTSTTKGKTNTHIPTNKDCSVCHSTSTPLSFTGAVFDHTGIVNNCESCHNGTITIGKGAKINPAHLATNLDCNRCHTTATFKGGTWVHDSTTKGTCDQCHSPGNGATPKSNKHLNTTEQCDVCHTTDRWAPTFFKHSTAGNYPGDHRVDPGCQSCHGATISSAIPWPFETYQPDCAACHADSFESESDHIGGNNGTVSQNRDCAGSGCHKVGDNGFD